MAKKSSFSFVTVAIITKRYNKLEAHFFCESEPFLGPRNYLNFVRDSS